MTAGIRPIGLIFRNSGSEVVLYPRPQSSRVKAISSSPQVQSTFRTLSELARPRILNTLTLHQGAWHAGLQMDISKSQFILERSLYNYQVQIERTQWNRAGTTAVDVVNPADKIRPSSAVQSTTSSLSAGLFVHC